MQQHTCNPPTPSPTPTPIMARRLSSHRSWHAGYPHTDHGTQAILTPIMARTLSSHRSWHARYPHTDHGTHAILTPIMARPLSSHRSWHAGYPHTDHGTQAILTPIIEPSTSTSVVVNLSNEKFNPDEIPVLCRGLAFCPTPKRINRGQVLDDLENTSVASQVGN